MADSGSDGASGSIGSQRYDRYRNHVDGVHLRLQLRTELGRSGMHLSVQPDPNRIAGARVDRGENASALLALPVAGYLNRNLTPRIVNITAAVVRLITHAMTID